jgi:hypothetical protein
MLCQSYTMRLFFEMFTCIYLLIAYSLYAVAGQGYDSTNPPPRDGIITVPATLKADPVQEIRIGDFKAEFEKTTLGEILNTIGIGSIQHAGDAGESQYWLCYSVPRQRIWLISHGEMGGRDHALTQVHSISTVSTSHGNDACPQMPTRYKSISMNFGWLGTSQKNLLKALGKPLGKKDSRLMYFYAGEKPGLYGGQSVEFDVIGFSEVVIDDGKITSVFASHVTSY